MLRSRRPDEDAALARVRRFADLMDRRYRFPGTDIRFGLDPIIGVLPVVGDAATAVISAYPIVEAVRLRTRGCIIVRMALNLGVDCLVGLVPVLDLVFDVVFKANVRNLRLLETELGRRAPAAREVSPDSLTAVITSDTRAS